MKQLLALACAFLLLSACDQKLEDRPDYKTGYTAGFDEGFKEGDGHVCAIAKGYGEATYQPLKAHSICP